MGLNQAIDVTAEQHRALLRLIETHLPHTDVWAYGSRVRWTSGPQSDLDLVTFAGPERRRQISDLREAFEESELPFRVDLLVWDEMPESFQEEIDREHVALVEECGEGPIAHDWLYHPPFPRHWGRAPLYSLAQWVNGIVFRKIQFSDTGVPVIKIAEIKNGIAAQTKFTQQAFDESRRVRPGDLLFSWSGQPETSIDAYRWQGPEGWLNQHIFRVTPVSDVDSRFFYYLLRHLKPHFVAIARNKQTTGLGHVTKRDLQRIQAAVPSLKEQRAIAHLLATLDDKIDLNRRMNETMEAMVGVLFESWFVNFAPVRAKMDGRDTGLPKRIADIFADRMIASQFGEIPEGWTTFTLDALVNQHTKSIAPSSTPETLFEHFSIPAYDAGQTPAIDRGAAIRSNKIVVPPEAVLLSKLNPEIRRVWMPDALNERLQICSTEFLTFTPRHPANRSLLLSLFADAIFRLKLQSMVTGTSKSHQRVAPKALKQSEVLSGTPAVFERFDDVAAPILARMVRSRAESRSLAAVRDTLLPKLISGELPVRDAASAIPNIPSDATGVRA